jgi:hypothetical protein
MMVQKVWYKKILYTKCLALAGVRITTRSVLVPVAPRPQPTETLLFKIVILVSFLLRLFSTHKQPHHDGTKSVVQKNTSHQMLGFIGGVRITTRSVVSTRWFQKRPEVDSGRDSTLI